jgi:DNA-binding NarL/FixJ family response regulator
VSGAARPRAEDPRDVDDGRWRSATRVAGARSGVEIVGECGSGMQALSEIRKKKPELVFLDVQMPEVGDYRCPGTARAVLPPALVRDRVRPLRVAGVRGGALDTCWP